MKPDGTKGQAYQVIYTWGDGRGEIRYTRPISDTRLAWNVAELCRVARRRGRKSPYSLRRVKE